MANPGFFGTVRGETQGKMGLASLVVRLMRCGFLYVLDEYARVMF